MSGQEFVFGDLSIACVEGMKEGRKEACQLGPVLTSLSGVEWS